MAVEGSTPDYPIYRPDFFLIRKITKEDPTPNYGVDAPVAVRNLLIVAALGIVSLITRLLGVWCRQDVVAVIARPRQQRSGHVNERDDRRRRR